MEFWLLVGGVVCCYYAIKAIAEPSNKKGLKQNKPSSKNKARASMSQSNRVITSAVCSGQPTVDTFN